MRVSALETDDYFIRFVSKSLRVRLPDSLS